MSEETPFKVTIKTPLGTFISVTADDVDTLRERIEAVRTAEDIIKTAVRVPALIGRMEE